MNQEERTRLSGRKIIISRLTRVLGSDTLLPTGLFLYFPDTLPLLSLEFQLITELPVTGFFYLPGIHKVILFVTTVIVVQLSVGIPGKICN